MARSASHGPVESPSLSPHSAGVVCGDAEQEFHAAVERYRAVQRRPFPTWSEILEIAEELGYRKSSAETTVAGPSRSG